LYCTVLSTNSGLTSAGLKIGSVFCGFSAE
jgi:hypothetical protein